MPLNFPDSPTVNDTHSDGGRSWTWNGTTWVLNTYVGVVPAGAVGTSELAANAVTSAKIADESITTAKIAAGAVVEADIASSAVTTAKIADANVTAAKLHATAAIQPTIVDAKGDLIVGTADNTVARQAVGANGTVLMADSAQTNGIAWSEQSLGYRNVLINGAMQVHQRGTSTASITSSGYRTADRWDFNINTFGTWTQTIENDAPTGSGFRKSWKNLCTTALASPAAGNEMQLRQKLEGLNLQAIRKGTASAKQLTFSFWVKSNRTGTYICELEDQDNNRNVSASYTVGASETWEYKTITFPADTTGAFDNDNNSSLAVIWWLGAGSNFTSGTLATTWSTPTSANRAVGQTNLAAATNNYWQITGVQLEAGSVATPFEFEDFSTTLAKCQRYYIRHTGGNGNYAPYSFVTCGTSTLADAILTLPTTMRASPTAVEFSTIAIAESGGGIFAVTALSISQSNQTYVLMLVTVASGLTVFRTALLANNNSATGYLAISAEL